MTNDERLQERREGAALMLEAWANGEDMLESTRRYYLELAEGYRAGRWDEDLSKDLPPTELKVKSGEEYWREVAETVRKIEKWPAWKTGVPVRG